MDCGGGTFYTFFWVGVLVVLLILFSRIEVLMETVALHCFEMSSDLYKKMQY